MRTRTFLSGLLRLHWSGVRCLPGGAYPVALLLTVLTGLPDAGQAASGTQPVATLSSAAR